jgi:hypothetical protein
LTEVKLPAAKAQLDLILLGKKSEMYSKRQTYKIPHSGYAMQELRELLSTIPCISLYIFKTLEFRQFFDLKAEDLLGEEAFY